MQRYSKSDKMIIFPSIDQEIRDCLNVLYAKMRNNKDKELKANIKNTSLRRCNRCGKYYLTEETVLRKYYEHSTRKYRLCKKCEKNYI